MVEESRLVQLITRDRNLVREVRQKYQENIGDSQVHVAENNGIDTITITDLNNKKLLPFLNYLERELDRTNSDYWVIDQVNRRTIQKRTGGITTNKTQRTHS